MKRFIPLFLAFLALATSCSSQPELEKMAFSRLPKALERAMMQEMAAPGGAEIVSPDVLYSCDSLCIIQCKAVARDPGLKGYSFPVRYVLVQDMVSSHAYGRPVYGEIVSGYPEMTAEETAEMKARFQKEGDKFYTYYVSTALEIDPEDL